jgi:hypothetical protein
MKSGPLARSILRNAVLVAALRAARQSRNDQHKSPVGRLNRRRGPAEPGVQAPAE